MNSKSPSPSQSPSASPSSKYALINRAVKKGRASESASAAGSVESSTRSTVSKDLYSGGDFRSLRIDGSGENQVESLCESLGLSGSDDLGISAAAWEMGRGNLASFGIPKFRRLELSSADDSPATLSNPVDASKGNEVEEAKDRETSLNSHERFGDVCSTTDRKDEFTPSCHLNHKQSAGSRIGGIKGTRPQFLIAPPKDSFAAGGEFTGSGSFTTTTSNDDDCSSTTTEPLYSISPKYNLTSNMGEWVKGKELGRGSYGTVFEAYFSYVPSFFFNSIILSEGINLSSFFYHPSLILFSILF